MNSHADTNITPPENDENTIDVSVEEDAISSLSYLDVDDLFAAIDYEKDKWRDTAFHFYIRPLEGENAKDYAAFEAERDQALNDLKAFIANEYRSAQAEDNEFVSAENLAYIAFDRAVDKFKEFTVQNPDILTEFGAAYGNAFGKPDSPSGNITLAQSKNGEITYSNENGIDTDMDEITFFAVDKLKKAFETAAVKEQKQELSEPMKRAMQLINEFCEAEYGSKADFSDLSKVDIAYTTDAETEVPIQVYADLENFRLVKEYDGKVVSENKYDSLDALSDNALVNLEFDELVVIPDLPAEEKAEEIPAPEKPDVIKDMGIEDSRITFTEVTFDENASFITVGALDENSVGEMEQLLDYAVENDSEEINVRAERYSVGDADTEPKDATPEQVSYIQSHRDEVISRAVPIDTQHFKVEVDKESVAARKAEILESSSRNQDKFISSLENSEKLLPFLNANRDFHSARLKTLNQKNATRTDKIERNEAKIERLTAKIEKLQAANEMLSSLFGGKAAPIRALIERNNARAEKIKDVKIPKREDKINKQLGKIERANKKIEREQCAVDKLKNLSKAIGSFGILNGQERRQQFAQAMDGLREASARSVQFKIEKCENRIAALSERYQTASAADRFDIAEKLKNQISRKNGFKDKLTVLEARESAFKPFEQQPAEIVDKALETAKNSCERYENALESGADTPAIEDFSEELSVSACERAAEIESERVQAEVEKSIKPDTFLSENELPAQQADRSKPKKAEKGPHGKRPDIIGSVKYSEIKDKVYLKMSAAEAQEKAEQLKGSDVRYSGRIYEDGKATLTVEKADVPKLREVTERKPSVLGEIGKIKAEQKDAPKKETPAKKLQEEL